MNRFKTYVAECAHLLYQIYFQPYSLRRKLRDIHPNLNINVNPFKFRDEFGDNPQLADYAEKSLWLMAVVPLLAIAIVAPIYSLFSETIFDFLASGLFLLGWWVGIWIAKADSGKWRKKLISLGFSSVGIALLFSLGFWIAPSFFVTRLPIFAFGVAIGVAGGVAGGVVGGVAFGVVFGVAVGVAGGVAGGVLYAVAGGVLYAVAVGVAVRVAVGVAVGVSFVLGVLRVYFWLPEFVWLLFIHFTTDKNKIVESLRKLPPYFDQLIHFPLPFMDQVIAAAHQQNPLAARNTIDYLINFTNQQKAASLAMLRIAVNILDRCESAGDIAASGSQLDWIPRDDQSFSEALPQMVAISQSVNAAYQATSLYRRLELLEQPLESLKSLRNSLAFGKTAKFASIYGPIAAHWQQILENSRLTLTESAQNSPEIPNRYIVGNPLDPDSSQGRFKGREDLFWAIEDISLSDNPPVWLLYGRRRTGKTSALKYLPDRVGGDLVPLIIDCHKIATSQKLANIAQLIADGIIETARTARNLNIAAIDPKPCKTIPFSHSKTGCK